MEFLRHTASDYERALREVRSRHGQSVRIHARYDRFERGKAECEILYYLVGTKKQEGEDHASEALAALIAANDLPYSFVRPVEESLRISGHSLLEREVEFRLLHHLFDNLRFKEKVGEREIYVAGPSGSGKTTMAAKIARFLRLRGQKKIALVEIGSSNDRLLRMLAHDCGVEFERISDLDEIARLDSYDHLIIDLGNIHDVIPLLSSHQVQLLVLVFGGSSKVSDMLAVTKLLPQHIPVALAFAKTDETHTLGNVLALANLANLPLFAFGEGASVAMGFSLANEQYIFSRLHGFSIELSEFF
ncbi:MAG TPA: hypothetical protein PK909_00660 [Sphaerochaeta sp.]|jgi:flagellar biosynthesis GTPase FlhF|nr:hypothetical protein [Sphaerochaeta sp.]HQB53957.1 hypothetical protein [Sphaerochaeta sp.]